MAKQTGQITVLKNNTVTNVEHHIRFIFTKENGERITRDTTSKGVINFDIPNGDWNVSWFAVDGDQKVLPLRAGLQLKITSSTPATALADWIYGDNTHAADPILAQWTTVLDEMKAVRDQFRDETSFVGNTNGKILKEGAGGILSNGAPSVPLGHDMSIKLPSGLYRLPANLQNSVDWQRSGDCGIYNGWGNTFWSFLAMGSNGDMALLSSNNGNVRAWNTFWGTKNTTVSSNGNVMQASPVVRLYNDSIEFNDHFSKEYEKQPVFEKLGVGHYKISNTKGLAKGEYEGDWNVDIPKDINGERYFNTEWQQLEDNIVIIRTYEREAFTEEYQRYDDAGNPLTDTQGNVLKFYQRHEINGKPIDIKDGRFIALRFVEDEDAKAKREADAIKAQEEFEEQERLRKEAEEQEQAEATAAWEAEIARQEAEMIAEMEGVQEVIKD